MGAKPFEGPDEIGLGWHAQCTAGSDDAEQDAGAVRAFCAAGEEHVQAELGDVLEFSLGGRVVNGHEWVVDEAKERYAVILIVGNRRRQRLGREERGLDGIEPNLKISYERADVLLPMVTELISAQAELLSFLFLAVDGAVAGHSEGRKSGRVSLGLSAFLAAARSLASLAR